MKKRIVSALLAALVALFAILGMTSCGDEPEEKEPIKLATPTVTLTEDTASWSAIENADKYEVSVDGSLSYLESSVTSKKLTDGQTLKVRAVGDGTNYTTGEWSNTVTYTAPEENPEKPDDPNKPEDPTPEKLTTPTVTVSDSGLATWTAVNGAVSYLYKINGGTEISTTATAVQLTDGQSITVKAVGNGTTYVDSDYSASVTYTAPVIPPTPEKLATPTVTVSDSGLATWTAVNGAVSYLYKINGGTEISTTATAVQLTDGQSITVKAVGNGTTYVDSDYSASVTYTAPVTPGPGTDPTPETKAPTYLGIFASNSVPTSNAVPFSAALLAAGSYVPLEESLRAFLENEENWLGDTAPVASNYTVYSKAGETVYVQIWLDNPDQNTILSLKLNGVKYQAGGALQSFFVEDGDGYLNCVYVALTVPEGSYREISYEVTEIEYVEGANVSQDGKAVMIDEENDTVTVGLPYAEALPVASLDGITTTASTASFTVNITDEAGLTALVGGWLRVVVYDRYNTIFAQKKLALGENTVTLEGLSADTEYTLMVFLLGDLRDGNGVYAHGLATGSVYTARALSTNHSSEILYNESNGKYYPVIHLKATLADPAFSFTKVEISTWEDGVVFTSEFGGELDVTEGILNSKDYTVTVYYKNAAGVEQKSEGWVWTESLDEIWASYDYNRQYGLVDDAIIAFDLGEERKINLESFRVRIFDENSRQYLAETAIYLIENPNAIADLEALMESLDPRSQEYFDAMNRKRELKEAQDRINEYHADLTEKQWREALAEGIYLYELTLGETDKLFRVGNTIYVILDGYQTKRDGRDSSWQYEVYAAVDGNDGYEITERRVCEGWFSVRPAMTEDDYLFAEEFTLLENGILYLETKSRNNLGNETYRMLGYVNSILLMKEREVKAVLWQQDAPPSVEIDEDAWLADIIEAIRAGEDVNSVFPLGQLQPITLDLSTCDLTGVAAGEYYIQYSYKMFGKTYTSEHPYDKDGASVDWKVVGQLPTASVNIVTTPTEDYGTYSIVIPEEANGGRWDLYTVEIRDAEGVLVGSFNQDEYRQYERLQAGWSVRVRLDAQEYPDYYTTGEFSDWFYCTAARLNSPEELRQSYSQTGITLEWNWVEGVYYYGYTVNGGEERTAGSPMIEGLKGGDVVKVRAIAEESTGYLPSEYVTFTVTDNRTPLSAPKVSFDTIKFALTWDEVENAAYYYVYNVTDGAVLYESFYGTFIRVEVGKEYRVTAIPSDYEIYAPSSSDPYKATAKLPNPEVTVAEDGSVSIARPTVSGRHTYIYTVNGGDEQSTTSRDGIPALAPGDILLVKDTVNGFIDSDWVELTYSITLATPEVTVSGGVASWGAIDGAEGYLYRINGAEPEYTTELSVSGLQPGDVITVSATSSKKGYIQSAYSEERTQLATLPAPVFTVSVGGGNTVIEWSAVAGATGYQLFVGEREHTTDATDYAMWGEIEFGTTVKLRAVCDNGSYEQYGAWSEIYTYEDTRIKLDAPDTLAYDAENYAITVVDDDPLVSFYVVKVGENGQEYYCEAKYTGATEVIYNSGFTSPDGESSVTVYVRVIPVNDEAYAPSDWATVTVSFDF